MRTQREEGSRMGDASAGKEGIPAEGSQVHSPGEAHAAWLPNQLARGASAEGRWRGTPAAAGTPQRRRHWRRLEPLQVPLQVQHSGAGTGRAAVQDAAAQGDGAQRRAWSERAAATAPRGPAAPLQRRGRQLERGAGRHGGGSGCRGPLAQGPKGRGEAPREGAAGRRRGGRGRGVCSSAGACGEEGAPSAAHGIAGLCPRAIEG